MAETRATEEEFEFTDFDAFWSTAAFAVIRMVVAISLARVGFVIIWCAVFGYSFSFGRIFRFIPRLEVAVGASDFATLVELSAWLGICGMLYGFFRAERMGRKLHAEWTEIDPDLGRPIADPPSSKGYSPALRAQAVDAGLNGLRIGTLVGSLAMPMTAWFEVIRDRWFNDYVTTPIQYLSMAAAIVPLVLLGYFYLRQQPTSYTSPALADS